MSFLLVPGLRIAFGEKERIVVNLKLEWAKVVTHLG